MLAAAEVFRDWGAQVAVGEGPGHVRDTQMALLESGMQDALREAKLPFADFNYQESRAAANRGRLTKLDQFNFPSSVLEADLIVSMPKLKTHHWVGMTASMKNLYGTLPGTIYGWPKNVLHYAGIPQSVVDINASLPPTIAIVDGILCMEGDGPILGTPKPMGMILVGRNPTAVDATCARIIDIDPARIDYLALANGRLGPIADRDILQRGEPWQRTAQPLRNRRRTPSEAPAGLAAVRSTNHASPRIMPAKPRGPTKAARRLHPGGEVAGTLSSDGNRSGDPGNRRTINQSSLRVENSIGMDLAQATPSRLSHEQILAWLRETDDSRLSQLWHDADRVRQRYVGGEVFLRGLIELSNYCVRLCAYCGFRRQSVHHPLPHDRRRGSLLRTVRRSPLATAPWCSSRARTRESRPHGWPN